MFTAVVRRSWVWLVLIVLIGTGFGSARGVRADDPPARPDTAAPGLNAKRASVLWPAAILLEPPADRASLLDKLRRPDLILWDGAGFDRWRLEQPQPPGPLRPVPGAVVAAVEVTARPVGGRASLAIRLQVHVDGDGRVTVPVALDGLILGRVTEGGTDLAVATQGERRAWAVDLVGPGEHSVEIVAGVAVRSAVASQSLELAIPPAATTAVALITARPLVMARAGPDEALLLESGPEGGKAAGHIGPRGRLELTWQEQEAPDAALPTVLAAQGEVAITGGLDTLETRETWSIAALRGEARQVVLRLKSAEELVALEVDRRPSPSSRRHLDRSDDDDLVVPLIGPLTTAKPLMLVLVTRRPRPSGSTDDAPTFTIAGHPILAARSQTGVIGVARSPAVEITPVVGKGIRRVDPRADLSDAFRGRPDGWLGFEFAEQPFDLGLNVAAVLPRFEVNARSTLTLGGDRAEVNTTLLGRVWQGRLFEVRVAVPPGLTWQPTEPTLAGPTVRPLARAIRAGDASPAPAGSAGETLVVTFRQPIGPGEVFAVPLRGTCRVPGEGKASVPLFGPIDPTVAASEVALVSSPNHRFDLPTEGTARWSRLDPAIAVPTGWTWPVGFDPNQGATVQWLRTERIEAAVRVAIATCPRSIHHRSGATVGVDRQGADWTVEVTGDVAHGTISTLDVALPPELGDRWVAEAGETLDREALDLDPATGWRRYRIKLNEPADSFQVRFRARLDFALSSQGAVRHVQVPSIRVLDGTSSGHSVLIQSETDVALTAAAPGWLDRPVESRGSTDSVQQVRRSFEHLSSASPAPIELTATLGTLADLPTVVASRLWLRSTELPGGALASTVQYRLEAHPRAIVIRLPAGSRWVRGLAGSVEIGPSAVEQVAPDTYRITLPAAVASGPVPLRIDSVLDETPADGSWPAPELVGGVVQLSAWELSLLGTRAGVGVPAGWTDENHWRREGLVWKRQPRRSEADLARWLTDGLPRPPEVAAERTSSEPGTMLGPGSGDGWSGDFVGDRHTYLFTRPGPPTSFQFVTFARVTLVFLCSGPVLLVGLLVLGQRPPPRWVIGSLLVLTLGLAATIELNTALLVAESSSIGFALATIAAVIHALLDRRGRSPDVLPTGLIRIGAAPSELSVSRLASAESNDPTLIRTPVPDSDPSTGEFPAFDPSTAPVLRYPEADA